MKTTKQAGTMTIMPGEHPALVKPIEIAITTVDDGDGWTCWIGDNEHVGIRCSTSSRWFPRWRWYNVRKLRREAVVDLDFMIDSYLVQANRKMSDGLRRNVENLKQYVDPAKRAGKDHWVDAGDDTKEEK